MLETTALTDVQLIRESARSGTRTRTPLPAKAFEASASTDSAIRAGWSSLSGRPGIQVALETSR
jgi:hypothetical protein